MHEPTLIAAIVTNNNRNVGGSLGGDVKARRVARQIAVKVPADPYVTELERSCDAATHNSRHL